MKDAQEDKSWGAVEVREKAAGFNKGVLQNNTVGWF